MKKTLVLAVVLVGFCICASGVEAANLGFWGIQHRVYEDGTVSSRGFFSMMDDSGASLTEDIVASAELYGPDGGKIEPIEATFWQDPMPIEGSYDADTGQWSYDTQGFLAGEKDLYYTLEFSTPLEAGTYRLKVVDTDGNTYEKTFDYAGPVELPTISSKSFYARLDQNGNFIMTWDAPTTITPEVDSSIRVWLQRTVQEEGYTPPQINPETSIPAAAFYVKLPPTWACFLFPRK